MKGLILASLLTWPAIGLVQEPAPCGTELRGAAFADCARCGREISGPRQGHP
jgi:hypothetical protein